MDMNLTDFQNDNFILAVIKFLDNQNNKKYSKQKDLLKVYKHFEKNYFVDKNLSDIIISKLDNYVYQNRIKLKKELNTIIRENNYFL